jgi:hypothetical protein
MVADTNLTNKHFLLAVYWIHFVHANTRMIPGLFAAYGRFDRKPYSVDLFGQQSTSPTRQNAFCFDAYEALFISSLGRNRNKTFCGGIHFTSLLYLLWFCALGLSLAFTRRRGGGADPDPPSARRRQDRGGRICFFLKFGEGCSRIQFDGTLLRRKVPHNTPLW